jgi:murein DD-endopeptidase MepM/ murein hydrolase activator NlpD
VRVDLTIYGGGAALVIALTALLAEPDLLGQRHGQAGAAGTAAAAEPAPPHPRDADAERVPLATVLALSTADSILEEAYRWGPERRVVTVGAGDTLLAMLGEAGVPSRQAHAVVDALETVYDPRDLQIGQELTLGLRHDGRSRELVSVRLMPEVDQVVSVRREGEGYTADAAANALEVRHIAAGFYIQASLAADAGNAGVPYEVLHPLIRVFSYSVDFQRDFQPGDEFRILYEREHHADGSLARHGAPLYAELRLGDRALPVYRFETADGVVDYYDPEGQSVRRALMRTPIDGARLSSGYGMRRHPILGYNRMHRGMDFAAPTGTPILAAGDGVIESIGPNSGYGNYIRIRHNNRLSTAYGHMSRFASGLGRGDRIAQGDVIGYVGSTGLSTGPHLHYEVLVEGAQVNPMSVDLPTGRTLEGAELARFREMVTEFDAEYATGMRRAGQVAENPAAD